MAPPGPRRAARLALSARLRCAGALLGFRFPGRLAQLGERRLDKAEVTGSSPVSPMAIRPVSTGRIAFSGSFVGPIWGRFSATSGLRPMLRRNMTDNPPPEKCTLAHDLSDAIESFEVSGRRDLSSVGGAPLRAVEAAPDNVVPIGGDA
jgi:hypothetical protein